LLKLVSIYNQYHTAQNISDALLVILDNWGLREKTNVIVTDNGSNMKNKTDIQWGLKGNE
jgi:hypothetical protein